MRTELAIPDAPKLPAVARSFRPACLLTIGQVHPVEVVFVERVGPDAIAVCRGLDDPAWHYEMATPLRIEVGSVGTVRCLNSYRSLPPRWLFSPSTESINDST